MTNANQSQRSQDRSGASRWPAFLWRRNLISDVVQGIIVGGLVAFITFQFITHAYVTKVNGWTTMYRCGEPDNSILFRAACAQTFSGPINVSQEAMYWRTTVDSTGPKLSGQHAYIMNFPAGHLPPNDAFWSLTMSDAREALLCPIRSTGSASATAPASFPMSTAPSTFTSRTPLRQAT